MKKTLNFETRFFALQMCNIAEKMLQHGAQKVVFSVIFQTIKKTVTAA